MTLTIGKLKNISAVMREKPENDALDRQVTKLEAVAILKIEIGEMLKKGYDLDDIAEVLKENDFDIQMPTLKSYFNKVREKQAKKSRVPKTAPQSDKDGGGS